MAGSGGQLGGIALGLREGIGQCGESAQQFVAADDPVVVTVAELVVYQGDLETVGVDVERQGVDRPGGGLRVDTPGEQDGEHSLTDAQRVQIGRSGGEGRPGDAGVTQVLVAQLGTDADDLLPPGGGVRVGQVDLGAQAADEQLVQVLFVDHVSVERRRAGLQRSRHSPHRQGFVSLSFHDAERGADDGIDRDRLLGAPGWAAPGRGSACAGAGLLMPLCAPLPRSRCHASIVSDRRTVFHVLENNVRIDRNTVLR